MKDKVLDQVDALPDAVRGAIAQWDQYRVEHPHVVVAGAILTVIGAVILLYGPNALALDFLRMLGFSELGPIAGQFPYLSFFVACVLISCSLCSGSWAARIQSNFYGPSTRGIFSLIQSITMKAKSASQPVVAFLGLSELAASIRGAIMIILRAGSLTLGHAIVSFLRMLGFSDLGPDAGQSRSLSSVHLWLDFLLSALYAQDRGPRLFNPNFTGPTRAASSPLSSLAPCLPNPRGPTSVSPNSRPVRPTSLVTPYPALSTNGKRPTCMALCHYPTCQCWSTAAWPVRSF